MLQSHSNSKRIHIPHYTSSITPTQPLTATRFMLLGEWFGECTVHTTKEVLTSELVVKEISRNVYSYCNNLRSKTNGNIVSAETGFISILNNDKVELTIALLNGTGRVEEATLQKPQHNHNTNGQSQQQQHHHQTLGTVNHLEFNSKRIMISRNSNQTPVISQTRRIFTRNGNNLRCEELTAHLHSPLCVTHTTDFFFKQ